MERASRDPAARRGTSRAAAVRALAGLLALLVLVPAGCRVVPETGQREVILASEESEQEVDEQAARQIEGQIGLVADPALTEYVSTLGEAMADQALRRSVDYRFSILEMDEPNAFALPGGSIYVSRGLLLLANSEAEVANVLGHEVGHVTARHSARQQTRSAAYTIGALLLAVAAAAAGAPEAAVGAASFLQLGGPQQALAAYSREQEAEADRIGQTLAAEAGVDPEGLPHFLDSLDSYTRLRLGAPRLPAWYDTHPATSERTAETLTRAQTLRWAPKLAIAPTRDAYLARIDGLSIGRPASEGIVRDGRFLHPSLGIALRFPPGWDVSNEHSRVIAAPPSRDALAILELHGPGDDPRAAASKDAERFDFRFEKADPVRLGSLEAFRVRTRIDGPRGSAPAEITWVAHRGRLYRLTGMAVGTSLSRFEGSFRAFARSFRDITPEELASIEELRLRVASAREGESLEHLGRRVGNEWDVATTAVYNALAPDTVLKAGQRIKIARREPYREGPPPPAAAGP